MKKSKNKGPETAPKPPMEEFCEDVKMPEIQDINQPLNEESNQGPADEVSEPFVLNPGEFALDLSEDEIKRLTELDDLRQEQFAALGRAFYAAVAPFTHVTNTISTIDKIVGHRCSLANIRDARFVGINIEHRKLVLASNSPLPTPVPEQVKKPKK